MELDSIIDKTRPIEDIIADLKKKTVSVPKWSDLVKEYDPKLHEIVTNKTLRKDKVKKNGETEYVARVTYGFQRLAARRMTQMAFAIPVRRIYTIGDDPTKKAQAKAIDGVYEKARIDAVNIKRMHAYFSACEMATIWYTVPEKNNYYGFDSEYKLRCACFSPMDEKFSRIEKANIYPLMNKYGDLLALSFSFTHKEDGQEIEYFEVYSATEKLLWKKVDGKWIEEPADIISIAKIPGIYIWRPMPIYEDTTGNTQEIEFTLSRESDIIRKNSAPIVAVKGKLMGETPTTDTAREVYQLEGDGDVNYVTWQQQIDAMKFYVSTLKQNMEEELQLPNLSMENVKGLGVISGEARKTLLTDAHLKVGDEKGDIIQFLDRECNVIKAFLAQMNRGWKDSIHDLQVKHIISPFVQNDELGEIDKISKATGGKAIASQKEGIKRLGWTENVDAELSQIQQEEAAERSFDLYSPTK